MTALRIYLAGPDVFLPNAAAVAEAKKTLCGAYGFEGVSPVDNEADTAGLPKHEAALKIFAANERAIRNCDSLLANLTPFRGPSADPGTAYEIGFARALGRPIFAYTNVADSLLERMRLQAGNRLVRRASGQYEDADHMAIEDFDCADNLMLVGAVEGSGSPIVMHATAPSGRYTDLVGFEMCLKLAASHFKLGRRAASAGNL